MVTQPPAEGSGNSQGKGPGWGAASSSRSDNSPLVIPHLVHTLARTCRAAKTGSCIYPWQSRLRSYYTLPGRPHGHLICGEFDGGGKRHHRFFHIGICDQPNQPTPESGSPRDRFGSDRMLFVFGWHCIVGAQGREFPITGSDDRLCTLGAQPHGSLRPES